MKFFLTLSFLSLNLMIISSSAHAVVDPKKVVERAGTNVQMVVENVANFLNVLEQVQANVLKGPMGAIQSQVADLQSKASFESFAPIVSTDLQSVMGDKGLAAVPDVAKYAEENLMTVNVSDGVSARDAYMAVNERLNVNGTNAMAMAKEVLAKGNEAPSQSDSQLAQAASGKNMQEKAAGEMGIDTQALGNMIAQNQLDAKLLEVKATGYMAIIQRSTLPTVNEKTKGGSDEQQS